MPGGIILFSLSLTLAYAAIMTLYLYGWWRLPAWEVPPGFTPRTTVSVVIPARNEAGNIGACLESVLGARYPPHLLEIVVVDDFSADGTAEVVQKIAGEYFYSPRRYGGTAIMGAPFAVRPHPHPLPPRGGGLALYFFPDRSVGKPPSHRGEGMGVGPNHGRRPILIRLLRLSDLPPPENAPSFGKKRAIAVAVAEARGELIVTTDADCQAPPDWLMLLVSAYETHRPRAIAAPVMISGEQNLLQHFQALDVAGTMGITGAGIRLGWQHIGNGANLAYPKAVFEAVGGYAGNAHQASGDDLFLLQKIARRWPGGVFFLKNAGAAVKTPAASDWQAFYQQRLRWGTKNAALPETPVRLVLGAVFLCCCSMLLNVAAAFFYAPLVWVLLIQLAVKAGLDYLLLREMCLFFHHREWLRWFWPAFFLHTAYVAILGIASLVWRNFEWKGRS